MDILDNCLYHFCQCHFYPSYVIFLIGHGVKYKEYIVKGNYARIV